MKINYQEILKKNMINVLKDVLIHIQEKGLEENHHLYITINTNHKQVKIPDWLKEKHPSEVTIVIQHEYWNLKIKKNSFNISLSFDDIKSDLDISFESIVAFSDPYANFGLKLIQKEEFKKNKSKKIKNDMDNIIDFKNFKKLR